MVRVFIAIDLPTNIRRSIGKIQEFLPEFFGKKTSLENLHLTLKFLGDVQENKIEKIKEALKKIRLEKFNARIDKLGFFSEKIIKIIWLHMSSCENLQLEIDKQVGTLGFPKEKRFMSHLTIARIKNVSDKDKFLQALGKIILEPLQFKVDKFKLKKSTFTEKGPVYEDLGVYDLV